MKRGEVSQALYRKYRSRGFDEVVGQQHVTDLLANAIKSGSISHAYLFTGPRGTGKTSVARIVAHAINELPYTDDATHLDIVEIDAASNRRIDDIRDLREKVYIAPSSAKYKVYIIDEVHMLTGESFNALLKTLEEPPAHAVFILATTELHKVPATIVSRTQRFHFRPGSVETVSKHLRTIADKESIQIDDAALRLIAQHSEGGFRDSVSLLDQVSSIKDGAITVDMVESLLGLAPHDQIEAVVNDIVSLDSSAAVSRLGTLLADGMSPMTIIAQLTKTLTGRASDHPEFYELLYDIIEIPRSHAPELKLLAAIGKLGQQAAPQHPVTPQKDVAPATQTPVATPKIIQPSQPETAVVEAKTPPSEPKLKSEAIAAKNEMKTESAAAKPSVTPPPTTESHPFDWSVVLAETQKRAPALYSILKRADTTVETDKIVLRFGFKLHRTKMNDDKQRRELASIITNLFGSCPEIVIEGDSVTLDDTSAAVADIMGGGVPVQVPPDGKS